MNNNFLAIFLSAQVLDVLSTYYSVNFMDVGESNPIASFLFKNIGMEESMILKLSIALFFAFLYLFVYKRIAVLKNALEKSLRLGSFLTLVAVSVNISLMLLIYLYF